MARTVSSSPGNCLSGLQGNWLILALLCPSTFVLDLGLPQMWKSRLPALRECGNPLVRSLSLLSYSFVPKGAFSSTYLSFLWMVSFSLLGLQRFRAGTFLGYHSVD